MRARTLLLTALLACVALSTAAISAQGSGSRSSARTVVIRLVEFTPSQLTIRTGQSVTFRWDDDDTNHNVRSTSRLRFKGATTRSKGSHRVRLHRRGLYRYECTLHIGMTGSIRVK